MATTTNFGWETPDDTDLVKDGAAAIRTALGGVDTSFVDLKGGTTGQILSKASNTDLDFTWVADAGAPTSFGYAAGKNKIINGDMSVWQRGTSFSNIFGVYTADRYISGFGSGGTQSISRQDVTGSTGLPNDIRYAMRYATTSAASNQYNVTQRIEDVQTLAGQTVIFSFYARRVSGTGTTIRLNAYQIFGTGGSTFTQPVTDIDFTVTSSDFQRFTYSFTMPSMAGKTIGTSSYLDFRLGFPTAVSTFDVTGWQLEAGSTATTFQTATGTIQGELAACQRYYEVTGGGSTGRNNSTTTTELAITFKINKRVQPTMSIFTSSPKIYDPAVGTRTGSGSTISSPVSPTTTGAIVGVNGFTGLTSGNLIFSHDTDFVVASAEL